MAKKKVSSEKQVKKIRPALTPEARENQLISLAYDQAEKELLAGTASSQVVTHFLKLGTIKESLEREKLEKENELLRAKTDAIKSAKNLESIYEQALNAMQLYRGDRSNDYDEDGE